MPLVVLGQATPSNPSSTDWVAAAAAVIQALAITLGGGWALWQYRKSRKGQASLVIDPRTQVVRYSSTDDPLLLVSLRIRNASEVLFRHDSSSVVLMDASKRAADGSPLIVRFADQDPLLPVYGYEAETPEEAEAGRPFSYDPEEPISLEPGEVVDCAVAFPLTELPMGLLALRVLIQGYQGSRGRKRWYWSGFYLVAPDGSNTKVA